MAALEAPLDKLRCSGPAGMMLILGGGCCSPAVATVGWGVKLPQLMLVCIIWQLLQVFHLALIGKECIVCKRARRGLSASSAKWSKWKIKIGWQRWQICTFTLAICTVHAQHCLVVDWCRAPVLRSATASRTEANIGATLSAGPVAEAFSKFSAGLAATADSASADATRSLILGRSAQ